MLHNVFVIFVAIFLIKNLYYISFVVFFFYRHSFFERGERQSTVFIAFCDWDRQKKIKKVIYFWVISKKKGDNASRIEMAAQHETIKYLDTILKEEEGRLDEYYNERRKYSISRSGRFRSKNKKRDALDTNIFSDRDHHQNTEHHQHQVTCLFFLRRCVLCWVSLT